MRNILIICVDCLRYDAFKESLEAPQSLSSRFEGESLFFESAFTPAPWTHPATNSILTGLYPHKHGARHTGIYRCSVKEPWPSPMAANCRTIFSVLKTRGLCTLGISTIFWALNEGSYYAGCDTIIRSEEQDVFYKNVRAEWVVKQFKRYFDASINSRPFFAYLHFCDLHRPYDLGVATIHSSEPVELLEGLEEWDSRPHNRSPERLALFRLNKVRLYRSLLNYVLLQIHELIDFLKFKRVLDNTVIVITADHGEEFWDHEDFQRQHYDCGYRSDKEWLIGTGHGHTLFNEVIHVPLLLINPGFSLRPEALSSPVSLVDILPTVLDIYEMEPCPGLDGRSLANPSCDRRILVESTLYGYEKKALIHGTSKYIYSPFEHHFAEYDLRQDPGESNPNISFSNSRVVAQLNDIFKQFHELHRQ